MRFVRRLTRQLSALVALVMTLSGIPFSMAPAVAEVAPATSRYASMAASTPKGVMVPREKRTPKRLVVKWAEGVPASQVSAAASSLGFKVLRDDEKLGWAQVEPTKKGVSLDSLARSMRRAGIVRQAKPETLYRIEKTPNDPMFAAQWALRNTGQFGGTAGADIKATKAWDRTTGSKNIVVAVTDTGIDRDHPDLARNMWTNRGEIPRNGFDDDGNGYADDVYGYDFFNYDETVYDPEEGEQHGTHVAGIIGAAGNDATGVTGVNWNVTIMPVKFLGWGGWGDDYGAAEAIRYAVDNGAKVINASWGGTESELLSDAIDYAAEHGVLIVAAAGNWAEDNDTSEWASYPASDDSTNVVSVAASDHNDRLAEFSNHGRDSVDLAAPGVDVTSTLAYDSAGLWIQRGAYKLMYIAAALEDIAPTAAKNAIVAGSMSRLAPTKSTPVLVVDDSMSKMTGETEGVRLGSYLSALSAAGYSSVTTFSTEAGGVPSANTMHGKIVVWFTGATAMGWYSEPILSDAEQAAIGSYLDNGGRMLFASGEIATDAWWYDSPWFQKYFRAYALDFSTWGYMLSGTPEGPFAGVSGELPGPYREAWKKPWPTGSDPVYPIDDSAEPVLRIGGYGPLSGTSMAAPQVTGAAALLMAAFPGSSGEDVRARIENTVEHKPWLTEMCATGGRLDLAAAMSAYPGRPTITSPKSGAMLRTTDPQTLRWTPAAGGSVEATFEADLGLPIVSFSEDFESGTLGSFVSTDAAPSWSTTSAAAISGSSSAISIGLANEKESSIHTTFTVPPGGGDLTFSTLMNSPDWASDGIAWIDGRPVWYMYRSEPLKHHRVHLGEGEHVMRVDHVTYPYGGFGPSEGDFVKIDDVRVVGHEWSPLATAGAGSTSASFSLPETNTSNVAIRLRSNRAGVSSAWNIARDLRVTTDSVAPASPAPLRAVPGTDGDVVLSWTKPADADLSFVRVLRKTNAAPSGPNDATATIVYEGLESSAKDKGLVSGADVRYAAYARDAAENWSPVAKAAVKAVDTVAPQPASMADARLEGEVVALSWMNPLPETFAGVKVLRRTDAAPAGPNDPAATVVYDGKAASARDFALTRRAIEAEVHYAIYAYDESRNFSAGTKTSIKIDTRAPFGSMTVANDAFFTKKASVSVRSAVIGATEMRFDTGEGWGAWRPFAESTVVDLMPIEGPHIVRAEYRDAWGNTLELEGEIYLNLHAPASPEGLTAVRWGSGVKLKWRDSSEYDVMGYNVYVASSPEGPYTRMTRSLLWQNEYIAVGLTSGKTYYFKVSATDIGAYESAASAPVSMSPGWSVVRRAGADKSATSIVGSKTHFTSADTVILANGDAMPDALSAAGLAGTYEAPVLLTSGKVLSGGVNAEIARLGAKQVVVVGGEGVVSSAVVKSLGSGVQVKRIGGRDRFETSALAAREIVERERGDFNDQVFVANGFALSDALSAAPFAYSQKVPILLVRADEVPASVSAFMSEYRVSSALVVGGTGVVSDATRRALGRSVRSYRIAGPTRYATSARMAEMGPAMGMGNFRYTTVASGLNAPDAFIAAIAAGKRRGVMMLTPPSTLLDVTSDVFFDNAASITRVEVFGSTTSVTPAVADKISDTLEFGIKMMYEFDDPYGFGYPVHPDEMVMRAAAPDLAVIRQMQQQ